MKTAIVFKTIGAMLLLTAGTLIAPLIVAMAYDDGPAEENELLAFALSIAAAASAGLVLRVLGRTPETLGVREAVVVVPTGWVLICLFGCLPYLISGATPSFTDAYFETMSGFTTTGSSIFSDIEALPHGILFWRSLTHWLGGMGIVVLFLAILPSLGTGGYIMMKAELPGVKTDKIQPKVRATARILWQVYLFLTVAEVLLLLPEMDWFDAVCHSFGTLATGGFSTKNTSVEYFQSAYVDWVITLFMFLAGINFLLHYYAMRGRKVMLLWRNPEFQTYLALLLGAILIISVVAYSDPNLAGDEKHGTIENSLRYTAFQVVSICTTTGFATADYDIWPNLCRFLFLMLMFIGACSGSTCGGIKVMRIMLLAKCALREVQRVVRPKAVISIKFGGTPVEERTIQSVLGFFALYVGIFVVCSIAMCLIVNTGNPMADFETAISSVVATLSNIGPGLAQVGPSGNFQAIPTLGKWLLTACMLIGRLEVYSVLILFSRLTWKK